MCPPRLLQFREFDPLTLRRSRQLTGDLTAHHAGRDVTAYQTIEPVIVRIARLQVPLVHHAAMAFGLYPLLTAGDAVSPGRFAAWQQCVRSDPADDLVLGPGTLRQNR